MESHGQDFGYILYRTTVKGPQNDWRLEADACHDRAQVFVNGEQKAVFESAAAQMLDSAIDRCTGELGIDYEGLLFHVTAALPQRLGIDQTAVYGDYFYLEALSRYLNPDFKMYW